MRSFTLGAVSFLMLVLFQAPCLGEHSDSPPARAAAEPRKTGSVLDEARPPASSRWACMAHHPQVSWSTKVGRAATPAQALDNATRECNAARSFARRVLRQNCASNGCYDLWDASQAEAWEDYWRNLARGIGHL